MVVPVNKFQLPFGFIGSIFENARNWVTRYTTTTHFSIYTTTQAHNFIDYNTSSGYYMAIVGSTLVRSSDGINWSTITQPLSGSTALMVKVFNGYFYIMVEDNNFILVAGTRTNAPKLYKTLDGSTLTPITYSGLTTTTTVRSLSVANSQLLVDYDTVPWGGSSGSHYIGYTSDGTTWSTTTAFAINLSANYSYCSRWHYINSKYVGLPALSTGSNYQLEMSSLATTPTLRYVSPGDFDVNTQSITVGSYIYAASVSGVYRTSDGSNWSKVLSSVSGAPAIAYIPNGYYLVVYSDSNTFTTTHYISTDGLTWSLNYTESNSLGCLWTRLSTNSLNFCRVGSGMGSVSFIRSAKR